MASKICIYYLEDDITLFYTLYPLLTIKKYRQLFYFTTDLDYVLNRSEEESLILVRFFKRREIAEDHNILQRIRDRYKRVIYLDDTASADELNNTVFPFIDYYLKKQMYRDKGLYLKSAYGRRAYSDYYHNRYRVVDDNENIREPLDEKYLEKMHPLWNLGIGCYPKAKHRNGLARRIHPYFGLHGIKLLYKSPTKYKSKIPSDHKISARYGMKFDRNTVAFHRKIYEKTVKENPLFLTGRVPIRQYNRELSTVMATFSPFGWGEVCFRDFEAIINKSVLIKPNMSHIETWPNLYRENETYWPVDWDSRDLKEKSLELMENPQLIKYLSENALDVYLSAFTQLEEKVSSVLELIS
ncbi:MAG: hypothetical protein PQJ59_15315 [Spirochaetales bacterium]|nr:hypothetical protein [Spirochaetales bacterium]